VINVTHTVKTSYFNQTSWSADVEEPVQGIVVSLWCMHKNTRLVVLVMMKCASTADDRSCSLTELM
jgi:hypothetical protein